MHPLNRIRLQAGLPIDKSLEQLTEAEKMAKKNRDKDGKVETEKATGSRMRAAEKNSKKGSAYPGCEECGNKANKTIKDVQEALSEKERLQNYQDRYAKLSSKAEAVTPGSEQARALRYSMERLADQIVDQKKRVKKLNEDMYGGEFEEEQRQSKFNTSGDFRPGQRVMYDNGIWLVSVVDAQADMIGVIPPSMKSASKEEKDKAVQMVKRDKLRKMSQEEEECMGSNRQYTTESRKDIMLKAMTPPKGVKAGKGIQDMANAADAKKRAKALSRGDNKPAAKKKLMGEGVYNKRGRDTSAWSPRIRQAMKSAGIDPRDAELMTVNEYEFNHIYNAPDYPHKPKHLFGNAYQLGDTNVFLTRVGKISESMHDYRDSTYPETHAASDHVQPINAIGQAAVVHPGVTKGEIPTQLDQRGGPSMGDYTTKVRVPSAVTTALKEAATELRKAADVQGMGHTAQENRVFYENAAIAFEQLLEFIQEGSVESIKRAQMHAMTLMGPMIHKLPEGVWNFLTTGGQHRSLKSYMTDVSKKYPIEGPRNTL